MVMEVGMVVLIQKMVYGKTHYYATNEELNVGQEELTGSTLYTVYVDLTVKFDIFGSEEGTEVRKTVFNEKSDHYDIGGIVISTYSVTEKVADTDV